MLAVGVGEALGVAVAFQDDVGQVDDGLVAAFLESAVQVSDDEFHGMLIRAGCCGRAAGGAVAVGGCRPREPVDVQDRALGK